jgi:hypothetical protein
MEEFDRGELIFWGILWSIIISASGFFVYYLYLLTQAFLKILI